MDDRSFDRLARLLGAARDRRTGLKALVGGILGAGTLAALDDASDAKRKGKDDERRDDDAEAGKNKKKTCKPACTDGHVCQKVGKKRECVCPSGVTCGTACCTAGQTCRDGACADAPDPATCIAAGEPCKSLGRACCDGRVCASGQGGDRDVACYAPKTGRCERNADCVYGMSCQGGQCLPPPPAEGLGVACDATAQQLCAASGAVCTAYTGAGAPGGTYCTLGLRKVCTGDPQCTCYKCWYTAATVNGQGRDGRASTNTMACCHPQGQGCAVDQDCCLGLSCVNGTCGGAICVPDDTAGCSAATPCCNPAATCVSGTCTTCGPSTCPNGCCRNGQCQAGTADSACGTGGAACATCGGSTPSCSTNKVCVQLVANGQSCTGGAQCIDSKASCTTFASGSGGNTGDYCLLPTGETCGSDNGVCVTNTCTSTVCGACNVSPIETKMAYAYKFPAKGTWSITDFHPLTEIDYVVIDPDAISATDGYAWAAGRNGSRVARITLSDRSVVAGGELGFFSNQRLTGVAVSSDGALVLVAGGANPITAASGIYRVNTTAGPSPHFSLPRPYGSPYSPTKWIEYPAPNTGSVDTGYRQPEGLLYEGTSTSGTLWVGIWRGWKGSDSGADSKSDILRYSVSGVGTAQGDGSGVTTLAKAYVNVCGGQHQARQISRSGRTGDTAYLYIACDNAGIDDSWVIVFDPEANSGDGAVVKTIPVAGSAWGLAFLGDTMYVSDPDKGKIHPIALSGTGSALTYVPQCVLTYQTNPFPKGMALDTRSGANGGGNVWLGAYTDATMTVTKFEVCTGTATNGVCGS